MPFGKPKEPKAPKEKKPKKPKPPKKEKPPKKPKPAKKPKPPKKVKPTKKPRKGAPAQNGEGAEGQGEEQPKKKKPILLLILIPVVVAAAAAALVFFVIMPRFAGNKDPEPVVTEPQPPVLPEELKVGEESIPGMVLEADESEAQAVLAKTVTYTYTNLNDPGKVAETYASQLRGAEPAFSIVDEDFVRTEAPDYTTPEGMVLLARNIVKPEAEGEAAASSEPTADPSADPSADVSGEPEETEPAQPPEPSESEEPADGEPDMVLTVRITWSEGQCVVVADEAEGKVTSPPPEQVPTSNSIGIRQAEAQLRSMTPAELGLEGTSMEAFEIFPQDALEMVDDKAYIKLNVYDSVAPYGFKGGFLMGVDGQHLYRVESGGELVEVEFTLNIQ